MRLIDLHAGYGRRSDWILRGVDADLRPGETVVVGGRNGAGKSTLLRVLAGLLPVGRGEVRDRPEVVGWLPERFPSGRPFTVQTYLRRMAAVQGLRAPEAWARIGTLAERLQFAPFLATPLASVSQGTRRKVGLTQALVRLPGLLVLDDPWEGLDATSQEALPDLLADVTAAGGMCVLTDHRGRAGDLGPVRHWRVQDGRIAEVDELEVSAGAEADGDVADIPAQPCHLIEIAVRAADAHSAVASLRAAGYDVRSVRTAAQDPR